MRLEHDIIVKALLRLGRPITRENWLGLAFTDEPPEDWANETEMPDEIAALQSGEELDPRWVTAGLASE